MNKLLMTLAAAALAGGTAIAAEAPGPGAQATPAATYYYWLHPKLGMVKVDRATNLMIVSGRQVQPAPKTSNAGHDHARMHKLM